jgi:hypothetical protein
VSGIIAAGIVPAALEMMDARITRAVEDFVGAGYPRDAEAVLLTGAPQGAVDERAVGAATLALLTAAPASTGKAVLVAVDDAGRVTLAKSASTPADPSVGVMDGLGLLAAEMRTDLAGLLADWCEVFRRAGDGTAADDLCRRRAARRR